MLSFSTYLVILTRRRILPLYASTLSESDLLFLYTAGSILQRKLFTNSGEFDVLTIEVGRVWKLKDMLFSILMSLSSNNFIIWFKKKNNISILIHYDATNIRILQYRRCISYFTVILSVSTHSLLTFSERNTSYFMLHFVVPNILCQFYELICLFCVSELSSKTRSAIGSKKGKGGSESA